MTAAKAYLGLGSNLGDRVENVRQAISHLTRTAIVEAVSSLYETDPWGISEQPAFLNAVCRIGTTLPPAGLLREIQHIEAALGRQRQQRWGPRTVDLDILFYDNLVMETADLIIPHPLLHERAFVLVPLAEIAPELRHPRLEKTVAELLADVTGHEGVRLWGPPTRIWAGVIEGDSDGPVDPPFPEKEQGRFIEKNKERGDTMREP